MYVDGPDALQAIVAHAAPSARARTSFGIGQSLYYPEGQMTQLLLALLVAAGAAQADRAVGRPALTVQAEGSPVAIKGATILIAGDAPPVLLYAATNLTDTDLDQFTVMVMVYDTKGVLKARHVAPGRHLLDARETKFSAMVLDGAPLDPADLVVVGANQAQEAGSDAWWRADLRVLAEAAIKEAAR
jgi:hypothetical protein